MAASTARAQQPSNSRRIAFVHSGFPAAKLSESGGVFWIKTFYEELRKLGYAGRHQSRRRALFRRWQHKPLRQASPPRSSPAAPELIVANQNAPSESANDRDCHDPHCRCYHRQTRSHFGLVSNIARPGSNLTGVSVDWRGWPQCKALTNPERDRADCDEDRIRD